MDNPADQVIVHVLGVVTLLLIAVHIRLGVRGRQPLWRTLEFVLPPTGLLLLWFARSFQPSGVWKLLVYLAIFVLALTPSARKLLKGKPKV